MRNQALLFLVIVCTFIQIHESNALVKNGEEISFIDLTLELEKAVDARNFQEAREIVDKMLPIMKKELKKDKKYLSDLNKAENPEILPQEFKKRIDRKEEAYQFVQEIIDSSPAALRVKSKLIIAEIDAFAKLSSVES